MRCKPDEHGAGMIPTENIYSIAAHVSADSTTDQMNTSDFNDADLSDELADDLAMLAEQLGDDANRLAELYPAQAPHFLPSVAALEQVTAQQDGLLKPMPVWMRWSAAAAVLVCALWGAAGVVDEQPMPLDFAPRGAV